MIRTLYLAGPDVFLPQAREIGQRKRALCERFGFVGCYPLDKDISEPGLVGEALGHAIYAANVSLMQECDAIIANVTPFRGPSADVGTAFEIGFFAGLGRPVFAYSAAVESFAVRTRIGQGLVPGACVDRDGTDIEPFELPDNLMLPGAAAASGGSWIAKAEPTGPDRLAAFAAFEACLASVAHQYSTAIAATA